MQESKWSHDEVEVEGSIRAHEPLVTILAHWLLSPTTKFEGCQGARAELDSTTTSLAAKRLLNKSCNCSSVVVSTNHVLVVARIRATTSADWSLPAWSSLVGGKRVDREITGSNNTDTEEIDYDRFRRLTVNTAAPALFFIPLLCPKPNGRAKGHFYRYTRKKKKTRIQNIKKQNIQ